MTSTPSPLAAAPSTAPSAAPVSVVVAGALGRMGAEVVKAVRDAADCTLVGAIDTTPGKEGADVGLELGLGELKREQARFAAAAAEIDPTASAVDTYRAIQREHPTAEGLLPEARKNVELIRAFLVDRNIVTIPSEVRPIIAETLPTFRATSFASMSTPGPFENKATEAYYYITPVDATHFKHICKLGGVKL
jgi:hypothetical protein